MCEVVWKNRTIHWDFAEYIVCHSDLQKKNTILRLIALSPYPSTANRP